MDLHLEHTFNTQFPVIDPIYNESINKSDECWGPESSVGIHSSSPIQPPRSTSSSSSRPNNRRPHARLAKASVLVMEKWLATHSHSPYPTEEDKIKLKQETGLALNQISSWFSNARKRGKAKPPPPASLKDIYSPYTASEFPDLPSLHPFERWLRLGPEHEAVSSDQVDEALKSLGQLRQVRLPNPGSRCRGGQWQFSHRHGSSISSLEIRSYGSEIPDVPCIAYAPSNASSTLTKCEHRRRRGTKAIIILPETSRRFYCTFCPKSFRTKHDWQRHEKSQHLALERWTCAPHGSGVNVDPHTNKVTCTFCDIDDPSPEHLQKHHFTACITRPVSERIFLRKDHLCQHLKLTHGNCVFRDSMRAWRTSRDDVCSRCGFCDARLETWSCRIKHLVNHFNDGKMMSDWKGDWGFDEDVTNLLENATLPEKYAEKLATDISTTSINSEINQTWNFCREGTHLENSLSPASTWLSSEPYQAISEYTPSLFADTLLFDEEEGVPQMYSRDWSNNVDFSNDPFSGLVLDPMDSLFEFEHAAKSDQRVISNTLECQYNWNNTESGFQVLFDDGFQSTM